MTIRIRYCKRHGRLYNEQQGPCEECVKEPKSETKHTVVVVGGLDLGKLHDYSALVALEIKDRRVRIKGLKVWPHVDYSVVVRDTAEIFRRTCMRLLAVDVTGVGEPVREMLQREGVKTEDIRFGDYVDRTNPYGERERAPIKFAMVEYTRACLQRGLVELGSGCDELKRQLKEQELVVGLADMPRYGHPEGQHDDLAWAFMMALYVGRPWITGSGIWMIRLS